MSLLKLYYLFQETSTLSNSAALLCKSTLQTYGSYSASDATTWCAANLDTFAATPFNDGKTLISYTVTTPMSSSTAATVLTHANRVLLNSTLWDNGFFSKETSLAAVVDVENGDTYRIVYGVVIGLYGFFLMVFTWVMYMTLKHKQCSNPCGDADDNEVYTSDEEDEYDSEDENNSKTGGAQDTEEDESAVQCCYDYKATISHALYLLLNMTLILTYGIIVYGDNDYIESKTDIGITEHIPFLGLPFFSVFLF